MQEPPMWSVHSRTITLYDQFIHSKNVKHMGIKPANLHVRRTGPDFRIYVADFGIARAYKSAAESDTDPPTSFTRFQAAPAVAMQNTRGYTADIFSLGCVCMEIIATLNTTLTKNERVRLANIRNLGTDNSYDCNLSGISNGMVRYTR
ncbi:hypothetical protein BU25DRAFT_107320 [Macroventuria anomochaeta]|uniref:Uncharacterized protein n=1 Tax=Macroventuria anomochaeta TaxID=301207 RepID=A0ACB6RWB4_9PLEO|nr:uncharacterized protein BU25DRAFT_107320 [Macroventuria anomochaeta]KAF2626023.1 hypothetical protein BU25DRAFT_107320 [Macroventuria anomochaeta]